MTLINSLNIARKGIDVNQKKMDATSNNITNINTPGYHKKQTITSSEYYHRLEGGFGGVKINKFQRYENNFLLGNLLSSISNESLSKKRADIIGRLEEIVGEPNGPISTSLNELFDSFNDLSLNPNGKVEQKAVLFAAEKLIANFKGVDKQLVNLRKDILDSTERHAAEVNNLLQQVSKFNKAMRLSDGGSNIPDQLENVLTELSEYIDYRVHWREDGTVALTCGGQFIADKHSSTEIKIKSAENGKIEFISSKSNGKINLQSGKMASELEGFNKHVQDARNTLNQLVKDIVREVNYRHNEGETSNGSPGGDFFASNSKTANTLKIRDDIKGNGQLIAASLDGSAAAAIASIPEETTLSDILEKKVFDIALQKKSADTDIERYASEKSTVESRYRSDVGVDLSEEVMSMVKQQRAYVASSRVFNTIKEMLDVVIRLGE